MRGPFPVRARDRNLGRMREDPKLGETAWRVRLVPALCLVVAGLWPPLLELVAVLERFRPVPEGLLEFATAVDLGAPAALIVLLVVAPVLEELLFRGLLLRALALAMPGAAAIGLSAALFAAVHGNLFQLLPAFTAGVLFGWVYLATRSLFLPILAHMFWNAQPVLLSGLPWLGGPDGAGGPAAGAGALMPVQPVWWLAGSVAAVAIGLTWLARGIARGPGGGEIAAGAAP